MGFLNIYLRIPLENLVVIHVGKLNKTLKNKSGNAKKYNTSLAYNLNNVLGRNSPKIKTMTVIMKVINSREIPSPKKEMIEGSNNLVMKKVKTTKARLLPTSIVAINLLGLS